MAELEKVIKGLRCLSNPYIQDMDERDCENCKYDNASCFLDVTADALSLLKAQEPGWISVKDRLPNCNGIYLVWRPHYFGGEIGEPAFCYFDGLNTWHDSYGVDFERILNPDDVTYWMPLPEPPKEG